MPTTSVDYVLYVGEHIIVSACRCFEYIEELIHKQEPLVKVLRLLILLSVTNSGLPKKQFDYLR